MLGSRVGLRSATVAPRSALAHRYAGSLLVGAGTGPKDIGTAASEPDPSSARRLSSIRTPEQNGRQQPYHHD
jgi:hypothetical protein